MNRKTILSSVIGLILVPTYAYDNATPTRGIEIDEVVITGNRDYISPNKLSAQITSIEKSTLDLRYESSLFTTATELVPGLFTTSRGVMGYGISTGAAGGVAIRGIGGSNSAQVLILIDGHPQYAGLMGHPISDRYQNLSVKKIEVVRGPASVLYGSNAMGGVINIITGGEDREGLHGNAQLSYGSYNSIQSNINSHYSHKKINLYGSVMFNRSDGHRENMEYQQLQGSIGGELRLSSLFSLGLHTNIANIVSHNPGTIANPIVNNRADITRGDVSLTLTNHHPGIHGALTLFHNWGNHYIDDGNAPNATQLTYQFRSIDELSGLNLYETLHPFNGNNTTFGIDMFHIRGDGWFAHQDGTTSSPWNRGIPKIRTTSNELAFYCNTNQYIFNRASINVGVRYNIHSLVGNVFIPQIGAVYNLNRGNTIKATIGKGYRNPTMKDMFLFPPQNPDLKPESLINYELSYNYTATDGKLLFDLSIYHIEAENIIIVTPIDGVRRNMNSGRLSNSGIEILCRYRVSNSLSLNGNYSLLNMKEPVIGAPEHKLFGELSYSIGAFNLLSGVQYIAGLYTSIAPNNILKEEYILWNIRMNYRICNRATIHLKGENLLNQSYQVIDGYPMPGATIMGGITIGI